ncbi:metal-sulfur cluster assembly factor [Ramlibacter sp.]|uniref:metal-sulfur cluster assembly factor n=1 Tax=Ramlibacter sp. TaxID=1917967 RepID=UPI002C039B94|nr:iron-sulfur cluster assembly protein [Ramlibacter sp.]HWI83047.1 iron-sulfur cluster assembly protein [Ramlibacter sp.]
MKTLDDFSGQEGPEPREAYPYQGPEALREPILHALTKVVDPEVAMSIVDVGLIYGVDVGEDKVHVRLTMTSAACPVTDVILDECERELDRVVPPDMLVQLELVWDPPWTMERMSDRARRFMGW